MSPQEINVKLAEIQGWMKCERLGKIVWYDPEGGHVLPHELPDFWNDANAVLQLLEKCYVEFGKHYYTEPQGWAIRVFTDNKYGDGLAPTFSQAACLALLKAHGIAVEPKEKEV